MWLLRVLDTYFACDCILGANLGSGMKRVKIGGKERPFKLGINALGEFMSKYNLPLEELDKALGKLSLIQFRDLIYYGLLYGAKAAGEAGVEELTPERVGDWIDELTPQEFQKLTEAIGEATAPLFQAQPQPKKRGQAA